MVIEELSNFRSGSVAVIGHDVTKDRDTTRAVSFVENFFDITTVQFACALLNCPINVVFGQGYSFRVDNRGSEANIGARVPSS